MHFDWDARKAATNQIKHGVSFNEAATVFGDALAWTFGDPAHSSFEERWLTIGASENNRLLVVSHTDNGQGTIRIISARSATRKERKFYEER